jgi:Na+-driven multidrug efflux pump
MGVIGLCYAFFSPSLIGLFTDEPAVIHAGALALRIMASGYLFYGSGMVIAQSINGAGDTRTPTILNFVFFWLVEIPLAAFLALWLDWGQTGVYWSIVIAESGMALAAIWVFRKGKWKTTKV